MVLGICLDIAEQVGGVTKVVVDRIFPNIGVANEFHRFPNQHTAFAADALFHGCISSWICCEWRCVVLNKYDSTDHRARHHCRDRSECDMGQNAGANSVSQWGNHIQHHSHYNYGGNRELLVAIKNV